MYLHAKADMVYIAKCTTQLCQQPYTTTPGESTRSTQPCCQN